MFFFQDETILKIFSFLDLQSLSRCAQVNKNFSRLSRDPTLYKCISLKPYWYCVDEYVSSLVLLGCPRLLPPSTCFLNALRKIQFGDIVRRVKIGSIVIIILIG